MKRITNEMQIAHYEKGDRQLTIPNIINETAYKTRCNILILKINALIYQFN